ncbi:MAG: hypothetical protein Q7R56_03625, partial [Nanoarchaeota archaeon]|nr:hypothetical protein [Nanoarchaeota archaeon]
GQHRRMDLRFYIQNKVDDLFLGVPGSVVFATIGYSALKEDSMPLLPQLAFTIAGAAFFVGSLQMNITHIRKVFSARRELQRVNHNLDQLVA